MITFQHMLYETALCIYPCCYLVIFEARYSRLGRCLCRGSATRWGFQNYDGYLSLIAAVEHSHEVRYPWLRRRFYALIVLFHVYSSWHGRFPFSFIYLFIFNTRRKMDGIASSVDDITVRTRWHLEFSELFRLLMFFREEKRMMHDAQRVYQKVKILLHCYYHNTINTI